MEGFVSPIDPSWLRNCSIRKSASCLSFHRPIHESFVPPVTFDVPTERVVLVLMPVQPPVFVAGLGSSNTCTLSVTYATVSCCDHDLESCITPVAFDRIEAIPIMHKPTQSRYATSVRTGPYMGLEGLG